MPQRTIDTELWSDPRFQELDPEAKLLYIYVWSNSHCRQSGVYPVSLRTMAFETGIDEERLPALLRQLEALDIEWHNGHSRIWVKRFLTEQAHSPTFLRAAAKDLARVSDTDLVDQYLAFNAHLNIPYRYPIDTLSGGYGDPTDTLSIPSARKTESETESGSDTPPNGGARSRKRAHQYPQVAEIMNDMRAYLGYPDRLKADPLPTYGKEGQAIKRMLTRGFTREEILELWKLKVSQRGGEFVSMTWVNEDIGKTQTGGTDARRVRGARGRQDFRGGAW